MSGLQQHNAASADEAMQGEETHARRTRGPDRGVEVGVWTERMLSALANGVKGGKWFSLMDKVFAPKTLALAWTKVRANKGAAGVDGQSIERFAARSDDYLAELSAALREGTYLPQAVRRVDIPKGPGLSRLRAGGRTRPLGIPTVKDRVVPRTRSMTSSRRFVSSSSRSLSTSSRKEVTASVQDAGAMMRRAEGARFQHDARGRSSDQGGVHPCGGRRSAGVL